MDGRQHLIENVKNWIHLDEELKRLRREMRTRREAKKKFNGYSCSNNEK